MRLQEFVKTYIEHNSIIRLVYKQQRGHKCVLETWQDVSMEHEILKGNGKYKAFINHEVIGIASICTSGPFSDAINIVIEEIPVDQLRHTKIDSLVND